MLIRWIAIFAALACLPVSASAQTQTFVIKKSGAAAAPALTISQDQKLMLAAAGKMSEGKLKEAEILYSQALAANGGNVNAYLQRALARRDLGDTEGMATDARQAVALISARLEQNPGKANLYYQRSLAERLLRQFDAAEKDLRAAIRLSNKSEWTNDLTALELERKMAK